MQIIQDRFLSNLSRILDLKLPLHLDTTIFLSDRQDSPLHQRVQHPPLDSLHTSGGRVGKKEQHRAARVAAVRMLILVECKPWLVARYLVDEFPDG